MKTVWFVDSFQPRNFFDIRASFSNPYAKKLFTPHLLLRVGCSPSGITCPVHCWQGIGQEKILTVRVISLFHNLFWIKPGIKIKNIFLALKFLWLSKNMSYRLKYINKGYIITFIGDITVENLNNGNGEIHGHSEFDTHIYQIFDDPLNWANQKNQIQAE